MPPEIITIKVFFSPFRLSSVNCYLLKNGDKYLLIDTGYSNKRKAFEKELRKAGCRPGKLELIVLTHGDFDHSGNAAYLQQKYQTKIAMSRDDSGMVEEGNILFNRKRGHKSVKTLARFFFNFGRAQRFKPDFYLADGQALSEYGFEAKVIQTPGHSKGSIVILTSSGELFCGDLLKNRKRPMLNDVIDDLETAKKSVEKLKKLPVTTVYPGHGKPFSMDEL